MKTNIPSIALLIVISGMLLLSSCATKKDCRGHTKQRMENGGWY